MRRAASPAGGGSSGEIAPARRVAFAVLRRVFEQGAYADHALQSGARELSARDRALAMRLVYGAVQRKATLDQLIERLAARPAERLDPQLLAALRLGLYELLYLQGAPDYAVVGDAVELAKRNGRGSGLVNAVLRRATREGAAALLGSFDDATPQGAALKHSHPEWIARLWWEQLGEDAARELLAVDNEPSEVALRANSLVTTAAELQEELKRKGVEVRRDPLLCEALVLDGALDLRDAELWRTGAFLAQSRAAMLVSRVLAPRPGERILDLCAAPGGKTTHLAALMEGRGQIVAVERNARRAAELERVARRMRAPNIEIEVRDAALGEPGARRFDRVLVDPPCSGLGTLQARPDLRWRVTPQAVGELASAQAEILAASAGAVRPGGVLVYSTCTISAAENERLIAAFLDSHSDFTLDDLAAELPAIALDRSDPRGATDRPAGGSPTVLKPPAGLVLTLPHRDHTAGFFIARMRRG